MTPLRRSIVAVIGVLLWALSKLTNALCDLGMWISPAPPEAKAQVIEANERSAQEYARWTAGLRHRQ